MRANATKLLLTLVAFLAISAAALTATFANFGSAPVVIPTNAVATGTLKIAPGSSTAIYTWANAKPGGSTVGSITVYSTGTLDGTLYLTGGLEAGSNAALAAQLHLTIYVDNDLQPASVVYDGALGAFSKASPDQAIAAQGNPGDRHTYYFHVSFASTGSDSGDHALEGLQVSSTYAWNATQGSVSLPAAPDKPNTVAIVGATTITATNVSALPVDVSLPASSLASETVTLVLSDGAHTITKTAAATAGAGTVRFTGIDASSLTDGPVTLSATTSLNGAVSAPTVLSTSKSTASYRSEVVADQPSAWCHFDESGTAWVNFSCVDYLGATAINGQYQDQTPRFTLGVPGAIVGDPGKAIAFNGTQQYSYGSTVNSATNNSGSHWSMEVWARYGGTLNGPEDLVNADDNWALLVTPTGFRAVMRTANPYALTIVNGAMTTSAGTWYDVTATYSSGTFILYANGVELARATGVPLGQNGNGNFHPGTFNYSWTDGSSLNGAIDEFSFYKTTLSPARVLRHYKVGSGQ